MTIKTRKKRCPNGFRKDNKTNICIKHNHITIFKELNDHTISKTKTTVSIESLNPSDVIVKVYDKGHLQSQKLLDKKVLTKIEKKEKKLASYIIKLAKKIKKNPHIIEQNKNFQKFRRSSLHSKSGDSKLSSKINNRYHKGGNIDNIINPPQHTIDVLIQEDVLTNNQNPHVIQLQETIKKLEKELKIEENIAFSNSPGVTYNTSLLRVGLLLPEITELIFSQIKPIESSNGDYSYYSSMTADDDHMVALDMEDSGFVNSSIIFFIMNVAEFFFPNADLFTLNSYIVFISFGVGTFLNFFDIYTDPVIATEEIAPLLFSISRLVIFNIRKKTPKELELIKQLQKAKEELLDALE
jgi:hypothetical protein